MTECQISIILVQRFIQVWRDEAEIRFALKNKHIPPTCYIYIHVNRWIERERERVIGVYSRRLVGLSAGRTPRIMLRTMKKIKYGTVPVVCVQ